MSLCRSLSKNEVTTSELDKLDELALSDEFLAEFEQMEPSERQFVLDELAARPELWDEELEVMRI